MNENANAPIRKDATIPHTANGLGMKRDLKPGEHQADVIRVGMRTDRQPRQGLQPVRFECLQVVRTTEYPQDGEVAERDDDQGGGLDQPPARGQQGDDSIDWAEYRVESNDQGDIDREDGEIAGSA